MSVGAEVIYKGFWIEWAKGPAIGATITLTTRSAGFLAAFLANFVVYVGLQLWYILAFVIHQWRASRSPQNGIFHQRQVIFRNSQSPWEVAWAFFRQGWAWRKVKRGMFIQTAGWVFFTTFLAILIAVYSILSGKVTSAEGNTRLMSPNHCGYMRFNATPNDVFDFAFHSVNATLAAAEYAKRCYSSGSSSAFDCDNYVQSYLNTTQTMSVCPFEDYCQAGLPQLPALTVDTGLIDSREHLGINTKDSDAITFRKVTSCAPLGLHQFVTNASSPTGATDAVEYLVDVGTGGHTFVYDNISVATNFGWTVYSVYSQAEAPPGDNTWIPIPAFNKTDADVTLILIAPNSLLFTVENTDPVFSATRFAKNQTVGDYTVTYFRATYDFSIIGCTEQYQVCQQDGSGCTPLGGSYVLNSTAQEYEFSATQLNIISRMSNTAQLLLPLSYQIGFRGPSALRVTEQQWMGAIGPLQTNQWMAEVIGWCQTSLAILQQSVLDYVAQPADRFNGHYLETPSDAISRELCYAQMVKVTGGTVSFSAASLGLVIGFGSLVILVAFTIVPVTSFVQRKILKSYNFKRLQWIIEGRLQLQRQMYEAAGLGGEWKKPKSTIPITAETVKFGGGGDLDAEHPSVLQTMGNGQTQDAALLGQQIQLQPQQQQYGPVYSRGQPPPPPVDSPYVDNGYHHGPDNGLKVPYQMTRSRGSGSSGGSGGY
ncbi:hypothetical protein ANO11243_070310 [Dothideomycetidae sp. 11243]|nr:hypothetical protein ANO11243_070310 [fungal sp. No.11243]